MKPKQIILLVLLVLVLIVMFQNRQVVTLSFLFWDFALSQLLLVLLAVGFGFLAGFFTGKLSGSRREPV